MNIACRLILNLCFFVSSIGIAQAHKPSDAFMAVEAVSVRLSLALKDIDAAIESFDQNLDRQLTYAEFKSAVPAIEILVKKDISLYCGVDKLNPSWRVDESSGVSALEKRNDGVYVRLKADFSCFNNQTLQLRYRLFEDIDSSHRLLVSNLLGSVETLSAAAPSESLVLLRASAGGMKSSSSESTLKTDSSAVSTLFNFITEGFAHLAVGWDHLAFILVLVLPFMLWKPSNQRYQLDWGACKRLLYVISAFTLGHCLTLVLVTINAITVTGQWVEPTIALTIVISAALNLMPEVKAPRVWIPLVFGTVHGLGFSGVLSEMEISADSRLFALIGFNMGIELGQIAFVALWAVAQYGLIRFKGYVRWVVMGGSTVLMLAAVMLTIVRAST
jgi:HupE / UreJ protein